MHQVRYSVENDPLSTSYRMERKTVFLFCNPWFRHVQQKQQDVAITVTVSQASIGAALSLTELQNDRFDDAEQRLSINQSDKARGFLRTRAKFQVALVLHAYDPPHISHTPHVFITQRAVNISFSPLPRLYTSHYLTRCFLQESLPALCAQAPSGAHQEHDQRASMRLLRFQHSVCDVRFA